MPKKEKVWNGGMPKGSIGPFVWQAWVKGSKKPVRVVAFDLQHIKDQLSGQAVIEARQLPEEKEEFSKSLPLGPKGYRGSSRTAPCPPPPMPASPKTVAAGCIRKACPPSARPGSATATGSSIPAPSGG